MSRHSAPARVTLPIIVGRMIVRILAGIGFVFVALLIVFFATGPHTTSAEATSSTTTYAPDPACEPKPGDFFYPCADLTPINGTDYRITADPNYHPGDDTRMGA